VKNVKKLVYKLSFAVHGVHYRWQDDEIDGSIESIGIS
jgi:hypothetical protein